MNLFFCTLNIRRISNGKRLYASREYAFAMNKFSGKTYSMTVWIKFGGRPNLFYLFGKHLYITIGLFY